MIRPDHLCLAGLYATVVVSICAAYWLRHGEQIWQVFL